MGQMKKIALLIMMLGCPALFAQVGGVSASKLATINTETVPLNTIEFEPSFGVSFYNKIWNASGHLEPAFDANDSLRVLSQFAYRFTYGAAKNLEIGLIIPGDVEAISVGGKYRLPQQKKYSLALLAGLNAPLGNRSYRIFNKKHNMAEYDLALAAGLAATYQWTDRFSIDADAQYQRHLGRQSETTFNSHDFFIDTDFGVYVLNGLQLIVGWNYYRSYYENSRDDSYKLTLNTGVTIERAKHFIIVANIPFDILGKNTEKATGFGFALTISLD